MNIFVAKLSFNTRDQDLLQAFEPFGEVKSAHVIIDKETGRSKGFGFVEMEDDNEAKNAIQQLNGTDLDGFQIVVNEARPREERPRSFNNNRGGGGGYGGGNKGGGGGGYNSRRY